jgi:cell wall-associated NlpC family hydrolase
MSGRVFLALLTVMLSGCSLFAPAPGPDPLTSPAAVTSTPRSPIPTDALDTLGLVAYAASMQGKPYRTAGDSPQQGFDCSGLVQHVFRQFDLMLPRSASTMAAVLPEIPLTDIQAADLLFFNTQGPSFSHVGIYLGDGRFVHAPSPKTGRVIISKVANQYWHARVTGARRPRAVPLAYQGDRAPDSLR